jgi:chitinase
MNARLISLALLLPLFSAAADFRVVGYLPEYRVARLQQLPTKLLTDLILFAIAPSPEGKIEASDRILAILPKLPRHENLRLHICIGGWAKSANFASVTADSAKRSRLVAALLTFCQTHRLHGVDVDWEFPRGPEQIANFAAFLRELRSALHLHHKQVSAAIAYHQTFSPEVYLLADYWHLMSYDNSGRHASYTHSVDHINSQRLAGLPRERLCLGLPFYGRNLKDREAYSYADIARLHAPAPEIDEIAGIAFNNVATIRRKVELARGRRLAGVMIWELGQDSPDHRLLRSTVQTP